MALVNRTNAAAEDSYSHAVSAAALGAVVPAWLAAGRDAAALWATVVDALLFVPVQRRLGLLSSLLSAMPEVGACCFAARLPALLVSGCSSADACQQRRCVWAGACQRYAMYCCRCTVFLGFAAGAHCA